MTVRPAMRTIAAIRVEIDQNTSASTVIEASRYRRVVTGAPADSIS